MTQKELDELGFIKQSGTLYIHKLSGVVVRIHFDMALKDVIYALIIASFEAGKDDMRADIRDLLEVAKKV